MDLKKSIQDDFMVFDGLTNLKLAHEDQLASIDFQNGKYDANVYTIDVPGCLIRQMSERLVGSVRQIFQRGMSIGNDNTDLVDTVIDVPKANAPKININDQLCDGERQWQVLGVDLATLGTRIRCACRSLKSIM